MTEEKKRPRTFRALAWRIIALTLALWIACMGILTWCVASDMVIQMQEQIRLFLNSNFYVFREQSGDTSLPGTLELNMIQRLGYPYLSIDLDPLLPIVHHQHLSTKLSSDDWLWGKWELQYGYEAAVIFYNEKQEPLIQTGDHLTFTYTTEENWFSLDTAAKGKSYVVLDKLPGGGELADSMLTQWPYGDMSADLIFPLLRLTGYFSGNEFHPTAIDRANYFIGGEFVNDVNKLSVLDGSKRVTWENMLTIPAPEGVAQKTIYAWDIGGYNCPPKKVSAKGETFDSLADLLHQDLVCGDPYSYDQANIFESILIGRQTQEGAYGPSTIAIAVRCKPLQYAALRLMAVYFVSFAVVALCLLLILRRLKYHITAPIEKMACAARYGFVSKPSAAYAELYELEKHFSESHQTLSENKAELQQLRTALDYARNAEEKRKQLISNITHELKTPLAIIHSYSESLQEDIPQETRTAYLQTILDETERMDAMVAQMLDLSRLEAGKIRLSSDPFSLLDLTKAIAEKMKPLFEERNLTLHFDFVEDFTITADEARIEQVITNLLTNAQKYTTEGGTIRIRIYLSQGARFYIENSAQPLSEEALEKVFDSFYRADESRNTPGVGLGLSLVKSIISLHGGTCSVRNTSMGDNMPAVEFGFVLPLK